MPCSPAVLWSSAADVMGIIRRGDRKGNTSAPSPAQPKVKQSGWGKGGGGVGQRKQGRPVLTSAGCKIGLAATKIVLEPHNCGIGPQRAHPSSSQI